jgi:hypothetical protein
MAEHLTEQEIDLYRSEAGDPGSRKITAAHLAVCRPCLERVLSSERSLVAVNALTQAFLPAAGEESFHLSPAELKSYVAGSSTKADQIICESHVDICEPCDQALRRLSTAQPHPAFQLMRRWSPSAFLTPVRLAAVVALIGLLTLTALVWRQRSSRPDARQSVNNGAPATPGQPPPHSAAATPQPGNEVVSSNPAVIANLEDNGRDIRLDQEGKLTGLEGFDESSQKMVKAALAGEGLAKPNVLDELSSPPIKLMGEPASETAFQLIGPISQVITQHRPALSWRPLRGATSYVVGVFDTNFNLVAHSPSLSTTRWTVDVPLQRGQIYSWEVTATKDGKEVKAPVAPDPSAQFKLIEADKLNALAKLKQQKPVSHLALGLMYARFGLVSNAEAEFRKVLSENPDSAVAKRLLRTVQTWR